MAAATTNVHVVTAQMRAQGAGLEQALGAELAVLAKHAAVLMKNRAPKFQSTLANSIRPAKTGELEWSIGADVDYDRAVEYGRKPGKGLPHWADPEAANIKAWLTSKAFAGRRRSRSKSGALKERDELRDRYQGLSWHVRHFGVKAQPFVGPVAEQMRRIFPARMEQAGRVFLAKAVPSGAGGAA